MWKEKKSEHKALACGWLPYGDDLTFRTLSSDIIAENNGYSRKKLQSLHL